MYYKNEKFSVDHGSIYPNKIILDKNILKTLPLYQKKVTLLDAICQAIESLWSKGSNIRSIEYAKKSLELIEDNYKNYLNEDEKTYKDILTAANLSGHAINITRTTAPHAMSYKLTKLYNIPHGYAVALTIIPVWEKLLEYSKKDKELETKLLKIANIFKVETIEESILKVRDIISYMKLEKVEIKDKDISILLESVNEERLKNSPVIFSKEEIREIYEKVKDF